MNKCFCHFNGYEVKDAKARPVINVSAMKSMNLVEGNVIKTLGYYEPNDGGAGTYLIRTKLETDIADNGSIHIISDSLVAELIADNRVNIHTFGGKVNDTSFDNTPILLNVIKYLKSINGGVIQFNDGTYYFNNSIELEELKGISIEGILNEENGTVLRYTGSGTFLNVTTMKQVNISNLFIEGNGVDSANGITIGVANRTNFKKVYMREFINLLYIKDFAYTDFSDCTFFGYGICETGIIVGNNYAEFLYFNRCSFDGGYGANLSPILVQIKRGRYVYFNNCDFCNTREYALRLDSENGDLKDVYFNMCTFMHILKGINIGHETNKSHLREIYFLNCLYELDGIEGEGVFTFNSLTNSYERNFTVKGLSLYSFNASVNPEFVLKVNGSAPIVDVEFEIERTNLTLSQLTFNYPWDSKLRIKLPESVLRTAGRFLITGTGGEEYTMTIANNSPYGYAIPCILHLSDNTPYNFKYMISSTNGGSLTIKIIFNQAIPEGTTVGFIYKLLTDVCYMKN